MCCMLYPPFNFIVYNKYTEERETQAMFRCYFCTEHTGFIQPQEKKKTCD